MQFHKITWFLLFLAVSIFSQDFSFSSYPGNVPLQKLSSGELLEEAKKNYANGFLHASTIYLTELTARNPDHLEGNVLLFKSYFYNKDVSNAKRIVANLEKKFPGNPVVMVFTGLLLVAEGKSNEARRIIEELEKYKDVPPEILLLKGEYYNLMHQHSLAERFYRKYIEVHPEERNLYPRLVENYLQQNRIDKAGEFLSLFRNHFPGSVLYYRMLADIHYKQYLQNHTGKITNLEEAYLHYKTYLNYTGFSEEVLNRLLNIAYLLNDKNKIKQLLEEYEFQIQDPVLSANKDSILGQDSFLSLKNLCENTVIYFSCPRWDFFVLRKNQERGTRGQYYFQKAKSFKKELDYTNYYHSLLYAKLFFPDNLEIDKELLQYHRDSSHYEDYYGTLQDLIVKQPEEIRWKLLMRRFLEQTKDYPFLNMFGVSWNLLKEKYRRDKKVILVMNPYPVDLKENHFRESDIIREYLNLFINFFDYYASVDENKWNALKSKVFLNSRFYLFYEPAILPVMDEWKREEKQKVDFLLEVLYSGSPNRMHFDFVLYNGNGQFVKKDTFVLTRKEELEIIKFLKDFLYRGVPLEGKYLGEFQGNPVINLGSQDMVKKDDIFRLNNSYYRVSKVYPYVSLLEPVRGKKENITPGSVFIKQSL